MKYLSLTVGFLAWMLLASQAEASPQSLHCYSIDNQIEPFNITESGDGKIAIINFAHDGSISASVKTSYNSIRSETHHVVSKKYLGEGVEFHISGHAEVYTSPAKYSGVLVSSASTSSVVCAESG